MTVLTAVEALAEGRLVSTTGETEVAEHLGDQEAGEGYWAQTPKSDILVILVLPPICSRTLDKLLPLSGPQFPPLYQEGLGQMLLKVQPCKPKEL